MPDVVRVLHAALAAAARPALLAAVVTCAQAASAQEIDLGTVRDPHFGTVLFDFYRGDHFGALTRFLAYRDTNRITAHQEEGELIGV